MDWHQDLARDGDLVVTKIGATEQLADISAKSMDRETLTKRMNTLGLISINKRTFMRPDVLLKVLAVMATVSEATSEEYYDDNFQVNVTV